MSCNKQAIIDAILKILGKNGCKAILAYTNKEGTVTIFSYKEIGISKEFAVNW